MQYSILYSGVVNIGKVRRINQDNFICDGRYMNDNSEGIQFPLKGVKLSNDNSVFGVFDGMGGEECGEIASYIAAQNASKFVFDKDIISSFLWFCKKTNDDICNYAEANGISAMGTTAAMIAFTNNRVTLCNIGDSKIFRYCDGILEQISKDHVAISAYGIKPPLSQNLGIPPTELIIEPYLAQGLYNEDDIYLICSDGLTDMVVAQEITEVLATKSIDEATDELLNKALTNGGRDNISIILCKIERNKRCFFRQRKRIQKKGA